MSSIYLWCSCCRKIYHIASCEEKESDQCNAVKGKPSVTKMDEFSENFQRVGGAVISDLKNFIANLVLVQPVCGKIAMYFPKIMNWTGTWGFPD